MRRILATIAALTLGLAATGAGADCTGRDLIAELPEAERAALRASTAAVPFAEGNLWQARRDGQVVHIAGTYHFDDPRHDDTLARLAPALDEAKTLLVEAGPEEEAALKSRLAREPELMVAVDGPTLPETLPPEVWEQLSEALSQRGVPAFMAAKLRPWYLSMVLSIPTCQMAEAAGGSRGLDGMLMDAATERGLPLKALEPYDTVFRIFEMMPQQDQLSMITSALAMEEQSADMASTLAEAYFAGHSRLIWEFMRVETLKLPGYTPERVEREFATMETAMMTSRNRAWIPVIEAAAAEGPVLAAFGALHLSGEDGVLNLLAQNGWTVTPLAD